MADAAVKIRDFISTNFVMGNLGSDLGADDSLMEAGLVDSTGVLELTAFLEEEFGIQVADAELIPENLDTISNIVNYIARKRSEA